jgi:glycosyltransferase involved in cell wall biosynthesis
MTIAVTIIIPVKNEETNLARCLARLKNFASVIVLDSGSTDKTVEIAKTHGATVLNFKWNGQYPKKRNWYLLNFKPSTEWVLFLDADEFVDDKFCAAIAAAIQSPVINGYWLNYTNYFLGKLMRFGVAQRKLALFRFGKGLFEKIDEQGWSKLDMEIHEHPIIEGEVGEISQPITHNDDRGILKFIDRHRDYAIWEALRFSQMSTTQAAHFTPRQVFKYRHLDKTWYAAFYFFYTYVIKLGILDGRIGLTYAAYKAWYFATICLLIKEARKP